MKRLFLSVSVITVLVGLCFCSVNAQNNATDFQEIRCQGTIPDAIGKAVKISPNEKSFNQFLRNMVLDGDVIYGTSLNLYVEKVADELLKNDPKLRAKLQFFILRSTTVNAYATEEGIIVVNVGLLAQLSNESELAMVLAHEITHYTEHHLLKIQDYADKLDTKNSIDYYLRYHNRSREQENEADRIGMDRFYAPSRYSYEAVNRFYDVLLYGNLPFNEEPFKREIVETPFFQFPDNYFLPSVAPITNREDEFDTLSTHPNLQRRREIAKAFVGGKDNTGRSTFIQSEESFLEMRRLARYECINIYLSQHQYDQALYNAHVLRWDAPSDNFLEKAMVEALYGVSKHKNYGQLSDILLPYKDVEGEMQQVSYFLSKLSRTESSVLALRFALNALKRHPEDEVYQLICKDILKDIFIKNKMKMSDFSDYAMDTDLGSIEETMENNFDKTDNKYSRIDKKGKTQKIKPNSQFRTVNYMLVDMHSDSNFIALYNTAVKEYEKQAVSQSIAQGGHPDVHQMIILTPQFTYLAKSKSNPIKAIKQQEELENNLRTQIINSCKRLKIEPLNYSSEQISHFNTEEYNDYSTIRHWSQEYHNAYGINMVYHQLPSAKQWAQKYGYQKVCSVVEVYDYDRFMNHIKWDFLVAGLICPYFLPASIVNLSLPRQSINISITITDITTGSVEMHNSYDISTSSGKSYANALIYDSFYRYKKGK